MFKKHGLLPLVTILLTSISIGASAGIIELRKDFKHNTNYTTSLNSTRVDDQKSTGTCWAHAQTGFYETANVMKQQSRVLLSEEFMFYHWILVQAQEILANPKKSSISEGAGIDKGELITYAFGAMPEGVWKTKINIKEDKKERQAMLKVLTIKILNYRDQITKNLVKVKKENPKLFENQKAMMQFIAKSINTYLKLIKADLDFYLGAPPSSFTYNGLSYDPISFAVSELLVNVVTKLEGYGFAAVPALSEFPTISDRRDFESLIKQEIDEGFPVYLGYQHVGELADNSTGIMSISAFDLPFDFNSNSYNVLTDDNGSGHAVLIVGYEVNEFGDIVKFKIKNSWGNKAGEAGYYHMYADYFYTFGMGVRVSFQDVVAN